MPEWKDVTSYSRADKEPRVPRTWEMQGSLRVVVSRHILYPGKWLLSCSTMGVEYLPLDAVEKEDAWQEARKFLRERAQAFLDEIQ